MWDTYKVMRLFGEDYGDLSSRQLLSWVSDWKSFTRGEILSFPCFREVMNTLLYTRKIQVEPGMSLCSRRGVWGVISP